MANPDLPDDLVARFHDPKVRRKIMVEELGGLLVQAVRDLTSSPFTREEDLQRLKNRLELDILKFCRNNHGWGEPELPLKISLGFLKGKPHVNLEGPLAYEVGIAMHEFMQLGQYMPLPHEFEDDEVDDEDDEESGFQYGR